MLQALGIILQKKLITQTNIKAQVSFSFSKCHKIIVIGF